MKLSHLFILVAVALTAAFFTSSAKAEDTPPIVLTIDEPGGPTADARRGKGKRGYHYYDWRKYKHALLKYKLFRKYRKRMRRKNRGQDFTPLMEDDGWMLSFRLAAPDSIALLSTRLSTADSGPNFETLVLTDTDDCLDLTHAFPSFTQPEFTRFPGPFDSGCTAGQDEEFILFKVDYDDAPGVRDTQIAGGCEGPKQARLVDDPFSEIDSGALDFRDSNKAYVNAAPAGAFLNVRPVGPFTGLSDLSDMGHLDCYGYGADEDLPSLVVMVNTGAARIFDDLLNYDNTRIRNMAGFISGVTSELLDNQNATTVVAHMPVRPQMLTPLTVFDIDMPVGFVGDPIPDPLEIRRKIEDGPVETFQLAGATTAADVVNELIRLTPSELTVEIRAVAVHGDAPEFIDDLNNDGAFTAVDLELAGFKLLSNEAVRKIEIVTTPSLAEEEDDFECPPLVFVDLDLDNEDQFCEDGDGTSRSAIRIPR